MSKILIHCPSCSSAIKVPAIAAGRKGKCPKCQQKIQVPAQSSTGNTGEFLDEHAPASEDSLLSHESNVENEASHSLPPLDPSDYFDDPGGEAEGFQDFPATPPPIEPIFADNEDERVELTSSSSPTPDSENVRRTQRNRLVEKYLWASLVVLLLSCNAFYSLKSYQLSRLNNESLKNRKWEYRIESPSDIGFTTSMNALGDEGWELVTARRASSLGDFSYEVILKRKK